MMRLLINTKIGENRGSSRIWLEQAAINVLGEPGQRLAIKVKDNSLVFAIDNDGEVLLSKRTGRNSTIEKLLVEVRDSHLVKSINKTILEFFPHSKDLRIVVQRGLMIVKAGAISIKRLFSIETLKNKLKNNAYLSVTSMYGGGCIFDRALHETFDSVGLETKIDLFIEREKVYVDSAVTNQPELFSENCLIVQSDAQELCFTAGEHSGCDIFVVAAPCTACSPSGRTVKSLKMPEDDPDAGNAVVDILKYLTLYFPPIFVLECERSYKNTASFSLIVNRLKNLSYNVSFEVLDGKDFGGFEPRKRIFLVATLFDEFDFDNLPQYSNIRTIDSILEDVPLDSPTYKSYDHLKSKLSRDKEKGNGFSMYLHDGSERNLQRIIRRLYSKAGSCEPFYLHPEDENKFRLFTSTENARLRDVNPKVVDGLPETKKNEILGQSGVYTVFTSLFSELANLVNNLKSKAA
ncbi:MAG: hypothetical protein CME38_14115 [Haliea sp.]|nr:hypothetical protein [Haliea sp.]